jgi:hypothetical protein
LAEKYGNNEFVAVLNKNLTALSNKSCNNFKCKSTSDGTVFFHLIQPAKTAVSIFTLQGRCIKRLNFSRPGLYPLMNRGYNSSQSQTGTYLIKANSGLYQEKSFIMYKFR